MSWLRDIVQLPADVSARAVADRLISLGLEVETVNEVGSDLSGPLVIGRVASFDEEQHSNGKTIRWCQVDVGSADGELQGIVCGALNFIAGDYVVVALPGAVLPGGFEITARKTYGHVSDGMICSTRELGVGDDRAGIWVLAEDAGKPGDDAISALRLRDDVLDIAVTPDRGYALSMRGVARECAAAFDVDFADPAALVINEQPRSWPVELRDPGCDHFVLKGVTSLDAHAKTPMWMQRRLALAGMRPISLPVDVTNYVMLELGQPLHAYDRTLLHGPIVVRRATNTEQLRTLDGALRTLDRDDLLITDDSGPIGIAGVMGGAATEINADSTDILIEAAHFDPPSVARSAKRHKVPSEASRRFARGVDTALQRPAAERAVQLLADLGSAVVDGTVTDVGTPVEGTVIEFYPQHATRLVGVTFAADEVASSLRTVGCELREGNGQLQVTPPSWRPDLVLPADLVEEVARLRGYDAIPSVLPPAGVSTGLTLRQRLMRRIGLALGGVGYVEVQSYPFLSPDVHDSLGLPADDPRRKALRLANPLSDEEPELRTSLLPGLLATARRNVGRGAENLALFEIGHVYRPERTPTDRPPQVGVDARPSNDELSALQSLLPREPTRLAVLVCGERERSGWWGPGRPASWADTVDAAAVALRVCGVQIQPRQGEHAPWHPGRCAALMVDGRLVGHAGELHPDVVAAYGLPPQTSAMELDLDAALPVDEVIVQSPALSSYPVAKEDVALVVDGGVPAGDVADALATGGGEVVESVRLFDIYQGAQVGENKKSLAFSLRLRAPDHTLTADEVALTRDAAVAEATRVAGATLRS